MIRRRFVLAGGLGTVLSALQTTAVYGAGGGQLSIEQIADAVAPLLPAQTDNGQRTYVGALASQLMRLSPVAEWRHFPLGDFAGGIELGPLARTATFIVIGYEAAPGARMPAHNHPHYSVVSLGIAGEARVRFFDGNGTPPMSSPEPFQLQETRVVRLRAGDVAALTPGHDNIHAFEAGPQGARWLDFTTAHGADAGFSYIQVDGSPTVALGSRTARWWHP